MKLFGLTDIGKIRSSNQDVYVTQELDDTACFALVCDGMGGESGGQIASAVASQTISEGVIEGYRSNLSEQEYKELVITAMSEGNIVVFDKSKDSDLYSHMGTTGEAVLVIGNKAYIAHVGDSRVYMLRDDELYQVTTDHSLVQTLIDKGELTPEEAAHHPQKNMITRALGVSRFVDIDYIEISNLEGASLLLCSDGLSNTVTDEVIKSVLISRKPEEVCETLIGLANAGGGTDNITAVLVVHE